MISKLKKFVVIIAILTLGLQYSFSQTDDDIKQIINYISEHTGMIVYIEPSGFINKNRIDFLEIQRLLKVNDHDSIPRSVIIDLADKFAYPDLRRWTYSDLPNKILIDQRDTILSYNDEVKRFTAISIIDRELKRDIRRHISNFNHEKIKLVFSISRPIFNHSGEYAVVQFDYCVDIYGSGLVILFKKIKGKWTNYVTIYSWNC